MTTVVYAKGVLAFDSRVTAGNLVEGSIQKGRQTKNMIMAGAGSVEDLVAVMDWLETGGDEATKKNFGIAGRDVDVDVLCVDKKGKVTFYGHKLYPIEITSLFYVLGSGKELALGALEMGASAKEAVQIAAKYDTNSGGSVRTLHLDKISPKTKKKLKRRKT